MTLLPFSIRPELPEDCPAIDALHTVSFGPGRFARAAFRVREGFAHDAQLSFVASHDGRMIGSVRLTPVLIGASAVMLLGPLAVMPEYKGRGAGRTLMMECMNAAANRDVDYVLLVGDAPYYGPFGFKSAPVGSIRFPAPVDPARVLLADLRTLKTDLPTGAVTARQPGC